MWFYEKNGAQEGPVEAEEIRSRLNSGEFSVSTLIWREGLEEWMPLGQVSEFSPSPQTTMVTQPQPGQPMSPVVAQPPSSGMSLASMILGILSLVLAFNCGSILGIPAVILGHLGRKQIRESVMPMSGAGMATAGLVMGYLSTVLTVVALIGAALFFGFAAKSASSSSSFPIISPSGPTSP